MLKKIDVSTQVAVEHAVANEIERCNKIIKEKSQTSKDFFKDKRKKLKAFLKTSRVNFLYYWKE